MFLFTVFTLAAGQTMPVLPLLPALYTSSLYTFHCHSYKGDTIVRVERRSKDEVI